MIHAQQKGATPPQILRGLCDAVARNFKGSISKGKPVVPPVAFVGGLARNAGIAQSLRQLYELGEDEFLAPDAATWYGAIGAALLRAHPTPGRASHARLTIGPPAPSLANGTGSDGATARPLDLENVLLLRDRVHPPQLPALGAQEEAYLGIDIGSVSTNLVVLNAAGDVLHEIYVRTDGRPIEVVRDGLRTIAEALRDRIRICGVGTTGSGRELIGELVGADTITDEITAHTTGAAHVGRTLLGEGVDTIFEIGGQDAKFIAIEDGVVVDFAMNEACAAGTGSFLEEQAERLGVPSWSPRLAFRSAPVWGALHRVHGQDERLAVARGRREDVVAGLGLFGALNYSTASSWATDRAGDLFPGGTAYNDARRGGLRRHLGASSSAPQRRDRRHWDGLPAQEGARDGTATRFRGFDLEAVRYFYGSSCAVLQLCDMQEFSRE
jgi:hypothetical protein